MGRPQKVDIAELRELHANGMRAVDIAKHFGVGKSAITWHFKHLKIAATRNVVVEQAPKIVKKSINAIEQLQKINRDANEILDLVMRWNRGEPKALQALEHQVKRIKIGENEELSVVEVKFKDPRELALKAMAEIRNQLSLQLEILQTLHDIKVVAEFQEVLIETLGKTSPELRDDFLARFNEREALERALKARPVKSLKEEP